MAKSVNVLALEAARAEVKRLIEVVRQERMDAAFAREVARTQKVFDREAKATARAERKAKQIAKLEAKLLAMKAPKVGVKAAKANRKPSKVTVLLGAEAQEAALV
jgi:phosphoribosylformylglycinamidine (FGAM) synthase-like enzyme